MCRKGELLEEGAWLHHWPLPIYGVLKRIKDRIGYYLPIKKQFHCQDHRNYPTWTSQKQTGKIV
jgi:hypothetical protein